MLKEKNGNRKDTWNIPMGRADLGECFPEAAVREVYEESGIKTKFIDLIGLRELSSGFF